MRLFPRLLIALTLGFTTLTASASPTNPVDGVDYRTLEKPQETDSGKKIEVIEFFWYACPHCNALEPVLADWVKKQGDNIVFKRLPVAFRDSFVPQQKLYYTLEAMGKVDELHQKVFYAIHADRKSLDTDAAIADFMAKQGIDQKKFLELYNSFAVQTKVRRATQLQKAYGIDGVPAIAVGGRYLTSPSIVASSVGKQSEQALHNATLQVMNWLIDKAGKETAPGKAAQSEAVQKK